MRTWLLTITRRTGLARARDQVEKHLAGCNWCAEFGDKYAGLVGELQTALREPEPWVRARRQVEDEDG